MTVGIYREVGQDEHEGRQRENRGKGGVGGGSMCSKLENDMEVTNIGIQTISNS